MNNKKSMKINEFYNMHIIHVIFNQIILKHWFCKMENIFQNKMNEMQKFIEKNLQTTANLENKIFIMIEIQAKAFSALTVTSETATIPPSVIPNQKQSIWVQIAKRNPDTDEDFQYVKKFKKTINHFLSSLSIKTSQATFRKKRLIIKSKNFNMKIVFSHIQNNINKVFENTNISVVITIVKKWQKTISF